MKSTKVEKFIEISKRKCFFLSKIFAVQKKAVILQRNPGTTGAQF